MFQGVPHALTAPQDQGSSLGYFVEQRHRDPEPKLAHSVIRSHAATHQAYNPHSNSMEHLEPAEKAAMRNLWLVAPVTCKLRIAKKVKGLNAISPK